MIPSTRATIADHDALFAALGRDADDDEQTQAIRGFLGAESWKLDQTDLGMVLVLRARAY